MITKITTAYSENYNHRTFFEMYGIDLLEKTSTTLDGKLKYYNSQKGIRIFSPKILSLIIQKDKSFNFYIERKTVAIAKSSNRFYPEIEVNFNPLDCKYFTYTINELKTFTKANFLPFTKIQSASENSAKEILRAQFGGLTFLSNRGLLKEIERNGELEFYINIHDDRNIIDLLKHR